MRWALLGCGLLAGCSSIQFSNRDDGRSHPYRVASPAIKVTVAPTCVMTAEVISIPGRLNYLKFKSGLGKVDSAIEFEPGGTIKSLEVTQEGAAEDLVKLLEAAGGLGLAGARTESADGECEPSLRIYPVQVREDGTPFVDASAPLLDVPAGRLRAVEERHRR